MQERKFISLAEARPDLAAEWNHKKNGILKPEDIAHKSGKKVWWIQYDKNPVNDKLIEFEWEDTVIHRSVDGRGNPFKSGHKILKGYNDLQTVNPELAKQWHPTKNGNLKPADVTAYSRKKVWWLLPYDDIKTGRHFDFEWQAAIFGRNDGNGCPYLNGRAVWKGFNDLQTVNPELAKLWHPTKNGNLKPTDVTICPGQKIWLLLPYDDIKTGKHFDFEWKTLISSRNINNYRCPYLSGQAIWPGFNDLETTNPELAKQWHPTKNGDLKPADVTAGSGKRVWWLLPYDDIKTGKHFDFEWQAVICNRNKNTGGCPYLSGKMIYQGFNDLQTTNPELAKQWHPTKNGDLKPTNVMANSNKIVWWMYQYNNLNDGTHFNFEWKASINSRNRGSGCPYLSGHAVYRGFNDLQTVNPELAKQWHPTKNGNLKPTDVTANSEKKVWWFLSYHDEKTGKNFNFEWKSMIGNRNNGNGCPYLMIYKGEKYVHQYLKSNNINFIQQQKFPDLIGTGGGYLSYDFSIPSKKYGLILIEYNGIQHYESSEFFGGAEQLKKQKEHDRLKKEYAKKHGYKLIIIKYTYDSYESISEYMAKELKKIEI